MAQLLDDYFSAEQLAVHLGISVRTLWRWHQLRQGPPRVKVGRRPLYKRASVAAWIDRQETDPAAAGRRRRA
jgi:predicted DNA-binding transcriptional regulator AlpA